MSIRRLMPFLTLAAVIAVVVLAAGDASACPTCSDAVAANSAGGNAQGAIAGGDAASGFNNAIYVTLGSLFSILGALGWKVISAVRRADAAQA